jgi:hypothetical protein
MQPYKATIESLNGKVTDRRTPRHTLFKDNRDSAIESSGPSDGTFAAKIHFDDGMLPVIERLFRLCFSPFPSHRHHTLQSPETRAGYLHSMVL